MWFKILTLFLGQAIAQTQEVKDKYPLFAEGMDKRGFGWEPHEIETEDGWFLTIFRITSVNGVPTPFEELKDKPPILF